jgi:hypothetical protein
MSKLKIITPRSQLIEKVSAEFAGIFYDAARSSGLKIINLKGTKIDLIKCKSAKIFARKYLEKFIADAVQHLTSMLGRSDIPDSHKLEIYEALMERVNDPQLDVLAKSTQGRLPEYEQSILYKPDNEKPKPIIVKDINSEDASRKT